MSKKLRLRSNGRRAIVSHQLNAKKVAQARNGVRRRMIVQD
jgi:hypothetical protein